MYGSFKGLDDEDDGTNSVGPSWNVVRTSLMLKNLLEICRKQNWDHKQHNGLSSPMKWNT